MQDINGRTISVGDYACKATIGPISAIDTTMGTVTFALQNGNLLTIPAEYVATTSTNPPDNWPWMCIGKQCGS